MSPVRTMRLECSSSGRRATDTLHGAGRIGRYAGWSEPGLGMVPGDALQDALAPFDGFVAELMATVPEDLRWG